MGGGRKVKELVPCVCALFSTRFCSDSKLEFFWGVSSTLNVGCSVVLGLTVCCVSTEGHCEITMCFDPSVRFVYVLLIIISIIFSSVVWNYIVLN